MESIFIGEQKWGNQRQLNIDSPDKDGHTYLEVTNKFGDASAIWLSKEEVIKMVEFLQKHTLNESTGN